MCAVVYAAPTLIAVGWLHAAAQTRESAVSQITGVIAGIVTADDNVGAALRRARVTLKGPDPLTEQTIVTGDDGLFRFYDLAAGRYTLVAAKEAYINTEYQARRPGDRGVPIVLSAGAQLTGISMRLLRGSVIAGRVLGLDGQPLPNRWVSVLAGHFVKGTRRLTIIDAAAANLQWNKWNTSDDDGNYRVYGLPPGDYVVAVGLEGPSPWAGSWHVTTADEIRRARASLLQPRLVVVGPTQPAPLTMPLPMAPPTGNPDDSPQFAPVYYPGTTIASEAQRITLGRSEERDAIDVQLMLTKTAGISGSVLEPAGAAAANILVQVLNSEPQVNGAQSSTVTPLPDGKFRRTGLAPGRYTVEARTIPKGMSGSARDQPLFAQAEVVLAGQNVDGLTLTLQPCSTISGRLAVPDGADPNIPVQVMITPDVSIEGSWVATREVTAHNGHFEINDMLPGRYRLSATLPTPRPANATELFFAGSSVGGHEATDALFELTASQNVTDAVISLTDRPSRLSGVLVDAASQPARDYFIIAFPIESSSWFWQSRRIRVQHAATDGSFAIAGLPSGDYGLAVVTSLEPDEAFDPSFLQQLVPQSVRVTIVEGATKLQNLRIAR
jgi:uncharacterized protein (DUF2141 family)